VAGLPLVGAGERALLVAEELALEQRLGERGAVHLDERAGRAPRAEVDVARELALAGAALAQQQHGGVGGGDLARGGEGLLHGGALGDQHRHELVGEGGAALLGVALGGEAAHAQLQLVHGEGFGEVVGGAGLHGGHRVLRGAVGGDDDDLGRLLAGARGLQHLEAVDLRHLQVGDDDVERLRGELDERLAAALRAGDQRAYGAALRRVRAGARGPAGSKAAGSQARECPGGAVPAPMPRRDARDHAETNEFVALPFPGKSVPALLCRR
jgi:hypothetical protein